MMGVWSHLAGNLPSLADAAGGRLELLSQPLVSCSSEMAAARLGDSDVPATHWAMTAHRWRQRPMAPSTGFRPIGGLVAEPARDPGLPEAGKLELVTDD